MLRGSTPFASNQLAVEVATSPAGVSERAWDSMANDGFLASTHAWHSVAAESKSAEHRFFLVRKNGELVAAAVGEISPIWYGVLLSPATRMRRFLLHPGVPRFVKSRRTLVIAPMLSNHRSAFYLREGTDPEEAGAVLGAAFRAENVSSVLALFITADDRGGLRTMARAAVGGELFPFLERWSAKRAQSSDAIEVVEEDFETSARRVSEAGGERAVHSLSRAWLPQDYAPLAKKFGDAVKGLIARDAGGRAIAGATVVRGKSATSIDSWVLRPSGAAAKKNGAALWTAAAAAKVDKIHIGPSLAAFSTRPEEAEVDELFARIWVRSAAFRPIHRMAFDWARPTLDVADWSRQLEL